MIVIDQTAKYLVPTTRLILASLTLNRQLVHALLDLQLKSRLELKNA